jgi:hypothetical protein
MTRIEGIDRRQSSEAESRGSSTDSSDAADGANRGVG